VFGEMNPKGTEVAVVRNWFTVAPSSAEQLGAPLNVAICMPQAPPVLFAVASYVPIDVTVLSSVMLPTKVERDVKPAPGELTRPLSP